MELVVNDERTKEILGRYIAFRANPTNNAYDDAKFCSDIGISITVLEEFKDACPDWMQVALQRRRQLSVVRLMDVDEGLYKRACAGDVRAAELLYERWEGYIRPKPAAIQVGVQVNLAEAIRDAHKNKPADDAERDDGVTITVAKEPSKLQ